MVIKYANILHRKTLQNLPKLGFFGCKQTIWQPCSSLNYYVIENASETKKQLISVDAELLSDAR
jgi:hypothetical protein